MINLKKELFNNLGKRDMDSSGDWLEEALDAAFDKPPEKEARESKFKRNWKWLAMEAGIIILAVLLIFNFVIGVSRISGDSMKPNFCDGDRVVIFRLAQNIEKGDIIVFKTALGEKLIKRVIATEGDTVDISSQGGVYINGKIVKEDYIYTFTGITDKNMAYPVTVGQDCFFVLGDNRTNSKDSRAKEIGLVDAKDLVGRVVLDVKGV